MSLAPDPDFSALKSEAASAPEDAMARLQAELERVNDSRREERFCWIVTVMILLNALFFERIETTGVALTLLILQLVLVFVLAKRLGVEQLVLLLNRIIDGWSSRKN